MTVLYPALSISLHTSLYVVAIVRTVVCRLKGDRQLANLVLFRKGGQVSLPIAKTASRPRAKVCIIEEYPFSVIVKVTIWRPGAWRSEPDEPSHHQTAYQL